MRLQKQTCTLSDFFGFWMALKINLNTETDEFSRQLLKHMNERHNLLMNNPILNAAVYLDPRYQRVLTRDSKELAVTTLLNIYSRLMGIKEPSDNIASPEESNDIESKLQQYLDNCTPNEVSRNEVITNCQDIRAIIETFNNMFVTTLQTDVKDFWRRMKLQLPQLYELAGIVMAIPPTQCTVERAFSSLGLLLTSLRTTIDDESLMTY